MSRKSTLNLRKIGAWLIFLTLVLVASMPAWAAQGNAVFTDANGRVNQSMKMPTGKTFTMEAGSTLNLFGTSATTFPTLRDALGLIPSSAGAVIYVSKESGATDTRTSLSAYDPAKPFATLKAAIAAASAGDTITVKPGAYSECSGTSTGLVLKSVTINARGATITYAGTGNPGLLNDAGTGGVTARIIGGTWDGGSTLGLWTSAGSTIYLEAEDLKGAGAYYSNTGTNTVTLRIPKCTGAINATSAGTLTVIGNNTGGVTVGGASAKVYFYGNVTAGIAVVVSAGYLEGWGVATGATSDALHVTGGTLIWHGAATSPGDCPCYMEGGSLTLYGPATCTGTAEFDLVGTGDAVAGAVGTMRIYGDVSGPIGVVCGEADIEIWGNVTSTTASATWRDQDFSGAAGSTFNHDEYKPDHTSPGSEADYAGAGVVKVRSTGRLVVHGKITGLKHGAKLDGGTLETYGEILTTAGDGLKMAGGTYRGRASRFNCSAATSNNPINISGGTCILTGCILLPGTGRDSIETGSSRTVYALGSGQTLASDANITFSPAGGMTTDSAIGNF